MGAHPNDEQDEEDAPHRQAYVRPELVEEVVLVQARVRVVDLDALLLEQLVATREHAVEIALHEGVEQRLGIGNGGRHGAGARVARDGDREAEVRGQHRGVRYLPALGHLVVLRDEAMQRVEDIVAVAQHGQDDLDGQRARAAAAEPQGAVLGRVARRSLSSRRDGRRRVVLELGEDVVEDRLTRVAPDLAAAQIAPLLKAPQPVLVLRDGEERLLVPEAPPVDTVVEHVEREVGPQEIARLAGSLEPPGAGPVLRDLPRVLVRIALQGRVAGRPCEALEVRAEGAAPVHRDEEDQD
mmetsp:Transcript_12991/g.38652  ORF Transcript_12991/g.38652 Transcript_12991/m.38652 type:complete len:297 (-) Transcript_12991:206-1096(-)